MGYRHGNKVWASKVEYLLECIAMARRSKAHHTIVMQTLDELTESLHAEVRKELQKKETPSADSGPD